MLEGIAWRGALIAFGIAAALAAVGSVAWAAIPEADGVINACYEKRLGVLRVIDVEAGKTCTQFETPISWNRQGTPGERGPKGESGKLALAGQSCPPGQFVDGFDAAGDVSCLPPPTTNANLVAALSPAGLNFGTVVVGSASSLVVEVTNTSASTIEVAPVQTTHVPEFDETFIGCSELAAGASCSVGLGFTPTASGTYVATFMVAGVELTVVGIGVA